MDPTFVARVSAIYEKAHDSNDHIKDNVRIVSFILILTTSSLISIAPPLQPEANPVEAHPSPHDPPPLHLTNLHGDRGLGETGVTDIYTEVELNPRPISGPLKHFGSARGAAVGFLKTRSARLAKVRKLPVEESETGHHEQ